MKITRRCDEPNSSSHHSKLPWYSHKPRLDTSTNQKSKGPYLALDASNMKAFVKAGWRVRSRVMWVLP